MTRTETLALATDKAFAAWEAVGTSHTYDENDYERLRSEYWALADVLQESKFDDQSD